MAQYHKSKYYIKQLTKDIIPKRVEQTFDVVYPFALAQQGLPAAYQFADYIYVVDDWNNAPKLATLDKRFRQDVARLVINNFKEYIPQAKRIKTVPQIAQLLISSFDTELWNRISVSTVDVYKPAWNDPHRPQNNVVVPGFPQRKQDFYKFNTKIFFQIKKNTKGSNLLTEAVKQLLQKYTLTYHHIEGQSREFCGVQNTVFAGRFNDGFEKPKDPYSFYLHSLIGYDQPQHLGGSYLIAQKCIFDWKSIHISNQSLPGVMGRNQILQGSTLFSQHHCPMSHIRLSRIKDFQGNPVAVHRQSKSYVTSNFDPTKERGITDHMNPQQGIVFLAYHKNPLILQKMMVNQLGNNTTDSFDDGLLNFFRSESGNILYTPNFTQLTGYYINRQKVEELASKVNLGVATLSAYHQIRWLKSYKRNEEDEELALQTGNPYFFYSRAGYLRRMSQAHEYTPQLNPPSPRTLRIISKTFSLWQDTWYYNRKQRQIEDLPFFLKNKPQAITKLLQRTKNIGYSLNKYKNEKGEWNYTEIPMGVRNGLAIYYILGYVLSTYEYGCRGPIDKTSNGVFGANTFHLQPEDVLAGGEANLTFGQGKHLIEYLTTEQQQLSWRRGLNISGHSGIGHVVPYVEEILEVGLAKIIEKFQKETIKYSNIQGAEAKVELFAASVFALLGMQQYFINYADYARELSNSFKSAQVASKNSLNKIEATMRHLATGAPRNLHEGAQLVLSLYICLHISGEPVSVGRLDYVLRKWAKPVDPNATSLVLSQQDQDIIDSFWIKVGEKPNFNKSFFEDHQKWGNLAMGGNSLPYPQGASFNQWGHQLTVGGKNLNGTAFFNSITIHCLRAARTVPVNAPCLGLRVVPDTPQIVIDEAAKAVLAGGAHPIILNDEKVIDGLRQSGNYEIGEARWNSVPLYVDGKEVVVPYSHWSTKIKEEHLIDYTSDGCHQFLVAGRSWFWLGGGPTLIGLEYVLNVGKSLLQSGPRWIHGQRKIYRYRPLQTYKSYDELQNEYFATFEDMMRGAFNGQLSGYSSMTKVCPASLMNAFTAQMVNRASDFYDNGTQYRLFCPQYTGVANLVNSLWNIKKLVFEQQITSLEEVRNVLLVNWGDELVEPFVSINIPPNMRQRLKNRCNVLRQLVWRQAKFGVDPVVTEFGLRISRRLSEITRKIFAEPTDDMLSLFKTLTHRHGSATAPFGFQYLPGCGTFQNYEDAGTGCGASFDGRKKGQTLAQDYSPQNFLMDKTIGDEKFRFEPVYTSQILQNFTHKSLGTTDPQFFSGAVIDLNIDQSYDLDALKGDIASIAKGKGTNLVTITVCSRQIMEEARRNTDRDLLRFRMGGWTQFAVSMFPNLLEQHIRRVRQIHPILTRSKDQQYEQRQQQKLVKKIKQ